MKNSAVLPDSKEVRELCFVLEQEMMHWPGVKMSHIFGTHAFYRRKILFAILPDKRGLDGSSAISFRTPPEDPNGDAAWHSFELEGPDLLGEALFLLAAAYKSSFLIHSLNPV